MCSHCGYCNDDFDPKGKLELIFQVLADSRLAGAALFFAQIVAVLGCIFLLSIMGIALFNRIWVAALVAFMECIWLFAVFVVLQRVSQKD